jgi:hypothetical protein
VVTDGEAGCAIAAGRVRGLRAARPVKAVDATGAGDAFLAACSPRSRPSSRGRRRRGSPTRAARVRRAARRVSRGSRARACARARALPRGLRACCAPGRAARRGAASAPRRSRASAWRLEELERLRRRLDRPPTTPRSRCSRRRGSAAGVCT